MANLSDMKNRTRAGVEAERMQSGDACQERDGEVVARFGEATLTRLGGRIFLRGGSMADRMEALEWVALFMPDAVPSLRD